MTRLIKYREKYSMAIKRKCKPEYEIAKTLARVEIDIKPGDSETKVCKLYLCQKIAYELGITGTKGYKFSKLCGYNFNITL